MVNVILNEQCLNLRDGADHPSASIGRSADLPLQGVEQAIKRVDRTREWYLRRAERAEELADQVLLPGNRDRLLRVAAQLRTKANAAASGAPQPLRRETVRGVDLWRGFSARLGTAVGAVGVVMNIVDVMRSRLAL
jgi:hypothetical protein